MYAEFPRTQRHRAWVARSAKEGANGPNSHHLTHDTQVIEKMGNAELLPLLEEPETWARLSTLERELVVRLAAYMHEVGKLVKQVQETISTP